MEYVRIKKGVTPFSGRRVRVVERVTRPNGSVEVHVLAAGGRITFGNLPAHMGDVRVYALDEVEEIADPAR